MKFTEILFTAQEQSWDLCLEEIRTMPDCNFVRWLCPGTGIIKMPVGFHAASEKLREASPIFIRHIFPIESVISIKGSDSAFGALAKTATELLKTDALDSDFSVQVRILDEKEYDFGKRELVQYLSEGLQCVGGRLSVQNPERVLSVVIYRGEAYTGVSHVGDNMSGWPGGMRRFAKYNGQISRAEFKLLEAIDTFGVSLPVGAKALDLGAAPGGWSKILLDAGMSVISVDPGRMAEQFYHRRQDGKFIHIQGTAQNFFASSGGYNMKKFDIIVNDMRMDIQDSATVMLDAADLLTSNGIIVMTFKFMRTHKKIIRNIQNGISILNRRYRITYAKQLFHNRFEITVVGRIKA